MLLWHVDDPVAEPVSLLAHESDIVDLDFSPDGQYLATAGRDGTAHLWNLDHLVVEPQELEGGEAAVTSLAVSPDGRALVAGRADGTLALWDVSDPGLPSRPLANPSMEAGSIDSIIFGPDGTWVAAGSKGAAVHVWQLEDPDVEVLSMDLAGAGLGAMAISPDGNSIAVASDDGSVRTWTRTVPPTSDELPALGASIVELGYSTDGQWLAALDTGNASSIALQQPGASNQQTNQPTGFIRLWNVFDGRTLLLTRDEGSLTSMAFSPNGTELAASTSNGDLFTWSMQELDMKPEQAYQGNVRLDLLSFSPDGRWLAAATGAKQALVWDRNNPASSPRVLSGHDSELTIVEFSPDSAWLMTADRAGEVRIWDFDSSEGEPLLMTGHDAGISAAVFNPASDWVATGGEDGVLQLWTVSPARLSNLACRMAGRNMTLDEWQRAFPRNTYRPTCPALPVHPTLSEQAVSSARALFDDESGSAGEDAQLSAEERMSKAVQLLIHARNQNPALMIDPQVEAARLADRARARELVQQGKTTAQSGDVENAVALFEEAIALDSSLDLAPNRGS